MYFERQGSTEATGTACPIAKPKNKNWTLFGQKFELFLTATAIGAALLGQMHWEYSTTSSSWRMRTARTTLKLSKRLTSTVHNSKMKFPKVSSFGPECGAKHSQSSIITRTPRNKPGTVTSKSYAISWFATRSFLAKSKKLREQMLRKKRPHLC